MKNINKLRSYLLDDEFKMIIQNDRININNYEKIDYLDLDKIIVKHDNKKTIIKGNNLRVTKLLNDEILIKGIIKNIEIGEL